VIPTGTHRFRPERPGQRLKVGADFAEVAEQLAGGGRQAGRYLMQAAIDRVQPCQHVFIRAARRLADGLCAHGR